MEFEAVYHNRINRVSNDIDEPLAEDLSLNDLGYEHTSAFIRAFKRRFGITPKTIFSDLGSTLGASNGFAPKIRHNLVSSYNLGESYPFELYVNNPRTVRRDSELVTEFYIPLKERL
jgi:AraC-like DNA-binding protein